MLLFPPDETTATLLFPTQRGRHARLFASNGWLPALVPVNTNLLICANPSVAAASDGSFMVALVAA